MTHAVNPEIMFQSCRWQHRQCISRLIIRVWNATDKQSQALTERCFERVSWHHQCCEFYSTGYSRFNRGKYLVLTSRRWYMEHCSILRFPQIHPKGKFGSPSFVLMATWTVRGDWANIGFGFCGTSSPQDRYSADNDVVVTRLVIQCGHIPRCAASPGV